MTSCSQASVNGSSHVAASRGNRLEFGALGIDPNKDHFDCRMCRHIVFG